MIHYYGFYQDDFSHSSPNEFSLGANPPTDKSVHGIWTLQSQVRMTNGIKTTWLNPSPALLPKQLC